MKNRLPNERISKYRQEIARHTMELKNLCMKVAHSDLLFGGTPVEVFRTCGKKTCHCFQDKKHGPYKAIQIRRDGKQRQITLRKEETFYYEMAQHYQYQIENRKRIEGLQEKILALIDEIIEARTIWDKK